MVEIINKPIKKKKEKTPQTEKSVSPTFGMTKEEKKAHTDELRLFFKEHRKIEQTPKKLINKYSVPKIKTREYRGCDISSISISNKIVIIERGAFENCKYLKKVIFSEGSSIEIIEPGAFRGCKRLVDIVFPKKVIKIYDVDVDFTKIDAKKKRELLWLITRPIAPRKSKPKIKNKDKIRKHQSTSPNDAKGRHYSWYRPK